MRACYLLQTHRDPAQIQRLVRTIRRSSPGARVLIGHDASGCELDPGLFQGLDRVDLLRLPGPFRRGSLEMLEPYFAAVAWLRERQVDFDWLVYLSGQDYPVRSLADSEAFLAASGRDGFLRHWDIRPGAGPWQHRKKGSRRYLYQYREPPPWAARILGGLKLVNDLQPLVHIQTTYGVRVGVKARQTPFTAGFACYAGKQWHTLSRRCVEYLDETIRTRPDLLAYYRRTICPDESLVQTLLVNANRFDLVDDDLRYADFTGSRDGRPRVLTAADFETVTAGPYHFARKVEPGASAGLLDLLDARVLRGS